MLKQLFKSKLFLVFLVGGIGYLLVQFIEFSVTRWFNSPAISDCFVRTATPLEIYHGAEFGLTTRVYGSGYSAGEFDYVFALSDTAQSERRIVEPVVKEIVTGRDYSFDYSVSHMIDFEANAGLRWLDPTAVHKPLKVQARFPIKYNKPWFSRDFELDAAPIRLPNIKAARQPNFKVMGAKLHYSYVDIEEPSLIEISLRVKDVIDCGERSKPNSQCVGQWVSNLKQTKSAESAVSWPLSDSYINEDADKKISSVDLSVQIEKFPLNPPHGTTIRGLLSIQGGWPQEITLQWPQKLKPEKDAEVKFSTKLADVKAN